MPGPVKSKAEHEQQNKRKPGMKKGAEKLEGKNYMPGTL